MRLAYIFYILTFCMLVTSCKDDTEEPGTYSHEITFIEPADGEEISSGDELHMEVDFNYSGNTIHSVGLYLINEASSDTLVNYSELAETQDFYTLHQHYITDVADTTEYMVVAWSSKADGSEMVSEHVHVTVNP